MDNNALKIALTTAAQHLQAGRLREVEATVAPVLRAVPRNADANVFMAIACHKQNRLDEALTWGRKAAELAPRDANILGTFGMILMAANRHDEAVGVFETLTKANPKSAQAFFTLGTLYNRFGRLEEALVAFKTLDRLAGGTPQTKSNLANILYEVEQYEEALEPAKIAAQGLPQDKNAQYTYAKVALAIGQPDEALRVFQTLNDGGIFAMKSLAYQEVALRELGRDEEADAIARYDDYVWPIKLEAPPGFSSLADFNNAICAEMLHHPDIEDAPTHRATRNGRKVSKLLQNPTPLMATFGNMLQGVVGEMQRHLVCDASDGPFPTSPPPGPCGIDLWVNIMHRQGHQLPHFHPQGWLSGCYYARVPDRVETSGDAHEGWIEFGRPAYHLPHTKEPKLRVVKPEEGLIVLFPSYMFHRTVPFESDDFRISFAFDVVPRGWAAQASGTTGAEV